MIRPLAIAILAFAWTSARAQVPMTDVYLMEMPDEPSGEVAVPINITDRKGYDNQPRFSVDGRHVYFTSIWDDEQADIYRHDVRTGVTARVTFSTESEYSPTPGSGYVDMVRVEADDAQRLWRFHEDDRRFELLLPDLEPVGYFGWIDSDRVAAFVLGEPVQLVLASRSGETDSLAANIGRTITRVPGRNAVSYIQKRGDDWSIDMIDFDSERSGTITPTLPGREDFAWTPDGRILMADGPVIYVWTSGEGTWQRFVDLSDQDGVGDITRIAVSPTGNLLAFVAERRD
jgi:hypothetical protein